MQLFTFNSQQLTANLKRIQPNSILPFSQQYPSIKAEKSMKILRSKKRIKRYDQMIETSSKNAQKQEIETKHLSKGQLKQYVVAHLNRINLNIAPMTMKLVEKPKADVFNKKQCTTQAQDGGCMQFTFYPKQKRTQMQTSDNSECQEPKPNKKLEVRSFSLKNSPIINYPQNHKILPRVFRVRTEGDSCHIKRSSDLSLVGNEIKRTPEKSEQSLALKECNRDKKRSFSIKCRIQTETSLHLQNLHRPILQALKNVHPKDTKQ